MQQYRDIKARHPQTILFFRMGDFYEMFEDDARLAARDLGLTLTSRNNGGAAEVPLAGVPVKAAAEYLGLSVFSIYRLVERRAIPFIPLYPSGANRRRASVRFDIEALDMWMRKHTVKPSAQFVDEGAAND